MAEGKGQPGPWEQLKNQIYLGSDTFVEKMQAQLDPETSLEEVPSAQRRPPAKPLAYFAKHYVEREVAIIETYASGGYSMRQIGEHFGLHYSSVSRIIGRSKTATIKT